MQDDEDEADGERPAAEGGLVKDRKGLLGPKKEADYDFFVSDIWQKISTKEEKQIMTAPLVWQVVMFPVNSALQSLHAILTCRATAPCPYTTHQMCWTPW